MPAVNLLDLAYIPVVVATAPVWARKARGDWPARFGRGDPLPAPRDRPRVLVHAVSVGEVNALRTLIPDLTRRVDTVLSVGTDTGIARARSLFGDVCPVVRYPLDVSWAVERFLDRVRPDAVALVELEMWPNFLAACARRRIPASVINGRLSERSFRGYRRLRPVLRPMFERLEFAAVQDEAYRERFVAMGVRPEACTVTGSMKWDAASGIPDTRATEDLARALGIDPDRPTVVAGSTARGEEALLHRACPEDVQLVCAPRHPERFDEAARDLPGCARRTHATPSSLGTTRFLLDTIGELAHAYALADVVVIGRSFGALHGSDPIEPSSMGKPVVMGPADGDFASIAGPLEQAGGLIRTTRDRLGEDLRSLIADTERRVAMGQAARACVESHRGASSRHLELLVELGTQAASDRRLIAPPPPVRHRP